MAEAPVEVQTFPTPRIYDFNETLRFARFGPGDPTSRLGRGTLVKAWRTRDGIVALRLHRTSHESVKAEVWGPGSSTTLARVPALLGLQDRADDFKPGPLLEPLAHRFKGMRLARVPWPLDKLLAYILQQRVRFDDASASWQALVRGYGEAVPALPTIKVLPPPAQLLSLGDHEWRQLGVDLQRRNTVREALRYAHRVHDTADMELAAVRRRFGALRGVGPWTVDMTLGFGFGDADAVPLGDYHMPHMVAWALAGEPRATDERMQALLAPYAGHRFRVIRWLFSAGVSAPRFGPRRPGARPAAS